MNITPGKRMKASDPMQRQPGNRPYPIIDECHYAGAEANKFKEKKIGKHMESSEIQINIKRERQR